MRELKFRAWDKEFEFMAEPGIVQADISGFMKPDKHDLMQFTGLKDKNGKEIYEGDILQTGWGGKSVVEYVENKGGYKSFNIDHSNSWATTSWYLKTYKLEVIGNIYENKELLK